MRKHILENCFRFGIVFAVPVSQAEFLEVVKHLFFVEQGEIVLLKNPEPGVEGSYTVKGFADNRVQITKAQGDNQTGLPGSVLPVALRVALVDSSNAPVAGVPVTFEASSGVQLSAVSAISDRWRAAPILN